MRLLYLLSLCLSVILFTQRARGQQKPLEKLDLPVSVFNSSFNWNNGYRFGVEIDGQITHLGGRWRTGYLNLVRLYSYPAGTVIDSAYVTGTGRFSYTALSSPLSVTTGQTYVVAVRQTGTPSGYATTGIAWPQKTGGIDIKGASRISASDAMPTNLIINAMYGQPDIIFDPCTYAGDIAAVSKTINEGDSVILTVSGNDISIQWQISLNGTTYTDVPGATATTLKHPTPQSGTSYRTRTNGASCGIHFSAPVKINFVEPLFPLRFLNPPLVAFDVNYNSNMGYRFKALKDGVVTSLGGRWKTGAIQSVRLYAYPLGTELASASVTGSMSWAYENISPVNLSAGQEYVVAVRLTGGNTGVRATLASPVPSPNIQILNAVYQNTNAMPVSTVSNTLIYGMPDFRFEPCVFGGTIVSDKNDIASGQSVTLSLKDTVGQSIVWQHSTDNLNYSNITGATDSFYMTPALYVSTYYRTIVVAACGSDTIDGFKVNVVDPNYVLQSLNPPITSTTTNYDATVGYRFRAETNGQVTELGGRWKKGVSAAVRLYAYPSGTLLDTAMVVGTGGWNYASIPPRPLLKGQSYVVAVRLNGGSAGHYGVFTSPVVNSNIRILGTTQLNGSNLMPTNLTTTYMRGMADIRFLPCVDAGTASSQDTLVCPGSATTLTVIDFDGNIQWQHSTDGLNYNNVGNVNDSSLVTPAIFQKTWFRVIANDICGMDTGRVVIVNTSGGGLHGRWTATKNTNWNDPCNWADGIIPSTGDSVFIGPSAAPPTSVPTMVLSYLELHHPQGVSLSGNLTITGNLNLLGGILRINNHNLLIKSTGTIAGGLSTAFIQASQNGQLRIEYTGPIAAQTIPVGDNSQFTPITLTINALTGAAGAWLSFKSVDADHPNFGSAQNRISRYWTIGQSDITFLNYDIQLKYADVDVVGNEGLIIARQFTGGTWFSHGSSNVALNMLSVNGLTTVGDFTGGDQLPLESIVSGNWNQPGTWSTGLVPLNNEDVIIQAGHNITLSATTQTRSLTINSGGTLQPSGQTLKVSGNLTVNGAVTGSGQIEMNGTSPQEIRGTFQQDILVINNSAGAKIATGTLSISNRLDIQNGNFNTNNNLILLSNASRTANLGPVTGSLSGQLTVQRYLGGLASAVQFRHFTVPVIGAKLSNIMYHAGLNSGGIYMYGFSGSNFPAWSWANAYYFSESGAGGSGNFDNGYLAATTANHTINHASPFSIYTGGSSYPQYMLNVKGNVPVGDISFTNLSRTSSNAASGWHFIGNPYPSAINWSTVSRSNVDAVAYVYNQSGWVASNLLPQSNIIATYQGFFVRVSSSTNSITFKESDKAANVDATFQKSKEIKHRLLLNLSTTGGLERPAAIDFYAAADSTFDATRDAWYLGANPGYPDLYVLADTFKMQVKSAGYNAPFNAMPIVAKTAQSGIMRLSIQWDGPAGVCLYLRDLETDSTIPLSDSILYHFYLSDTARSPRFILYRQGLSEIVRRSNVTCYGKSDGAIEIEPAGNGGSFSLLDAFGNNLTTDSNYRVISGLRAGAYFIMSQSKYCSSVINRVDIYEPPRVVAEFTPSDTTLQTKQIIRFVNGSQNATVFNWIFGDGNQSSVFEPLYAYPNEGNYTAQLIAQEGPCSDTASMKIRVSGPGPGPNTGLTINQNPPSFKILSRQQYIEIQYLGFKKTHTALKVYDSLGKRVFEAASALEHRQILATSKLIPGMYTVDLQLPSKHITQKVVVY